MNEFGREMKKERESERKGEEEGEREKKDGRWRRRWDVLEKKRKAEFKIVLTLTYLYPSLSSPFSTMASAVALMISSFISPLHSTSYHEL